MDNKEKEKQREPQQKVQFFLLSHFLCMDLPFLPLLIDLLPYSDNSIYFGNGKGKPGRVNERMVQFCRSRNCGGKYVPVCSFPFRALDPGSQKFWDQNLTNSAPSLCTHILYRKLFSGMKKSKKIFPELFLKQMLVRKKFQT
jgi:hypothetical protein